MPQRNKNFSERPKKLDKNYSRSQKNISFKQVNIDFCVCPLCGEKIVHMRGIPCYNLICPKCKTKMTRSLENEK